jgi:gamma-glutamyltranspeptidase / glutathione hydrolase
MQKFSALSCLFISLVAAAASAPLTVSPVPARQMMVVAAHPQAVEAGLSVLRAGGNAIDAAVATSLALGVAEPYGSGLGGKLMLLYYEAKSGRAYAVDGMDAAGSVDVVSYVKRPEDQRTYGYGAVCVPGLAAGLWEAHRRWGGRAWADNVQPAIALAREGFRVLPTTRDFFTEQERKLRRGDPEIARLYLPAGRLPEVGSLLVNEDLARTMELLARDGRDGFYRGPIAGAIVAAAREGGGVLSLDDLARYEARVTEPISAPFRDYLLVFGPPPVSGAALYVPIMKVLEHETFGGGPLRTAANLDRIGRVWRVVFPHVSRTIGDVPHSRFLLEKLLAPDSIAALRETALGTGVQERKIAAVSEPAATFATEGFGPRHMEDADELPEYYESPMAATTHFVVVDAGGNIVCATQSQSLHFGAGVVPPGTGVVMNNSMSNFSFSDAGSVNYVAPGKRSRSTISPSLVLRDGGPVLAIGLPGGSRIPTAMLQVLLDRLALDRRLAEAIGDTRVHYFAPTRRGDTEAIEAEQSLPSALVEELLALGWRVVLPEAAGKGRYFGGVNAVEFNDDGTLTGYADPRRTNVAAGD